MSDSIFTRKALAETKSYKTHNDTRAYIRAEDLAIEYAALSAKKHGELTSLNLARRKNRIRDASAITYAPRTHADPPEPTPQVVQADAHFNTTFVWGVLMAVSGIAALCLTLIASSDFLSVVGSIMLGVGLIMVALFVMDDDRPTSSA